MTELQTKVLAYFAEHGFLPVTTESYQILKSYETKENRLFEGTASNIIQWAHEFVPVYSVLHNYMCIVSFFSDGDVKFSVERPAESAGT